MDFTRLDRNLFVRVERRLVVLLEDQEKAVETLRLGGQLAAARQQKLEVDRIQRDLRELQALRKRFEAEFPDSLKAVPPAPVPVEAAGVR